MSIWFLFRTYIKTIFPGKLSYLITVPEVSGSRGKDLKSIVKKSKSMWYWRANPKTKQLQR